MKAHLYTALLLLGFLLLAACGGGGSPGDTSAANCTLGVSALDSCTLH
ncbi:MAG: hypothetical protein COB30_017355 [Ectothiorhodospiraceae bacterium]|nr:hypothetical protein [Ectothiorhodospiraceae bacterium]